MKGAHVTLAFEQVAVTQQLVDDHRMLLSVKRELAVKAIRHVPDESLARPNDLVLTFGLHQQVPELRGSEYYAENARLLTCTVTAT